MSDDPRFKTALADSTKTAWEYCSVTNIYPNSYTCDVVTDAGRHVLGVPWLMNSADPNGLAGEVNVPKRGERYAIHLELGQPQLVYAAPEMRSQHLSPELEHRIDYNNSGVGGLDNIYNTSSPKNFRGCMPPDVLPGDWVRIGTQGNLVGVLEGGVTVVKASELAKVVAHNVNDLLQLVGRNMDIMSDFGEIKFRNDGGHVSMTLEGGCQQTTESGATENKFTIHAALGHTGEVADFSITDPQGHVLAQVHYSPEGSVTHTAHNKIETLTGEYSFAVEGSGSESYGQNHTFTVSGNSKETLTGQKDIIASGVNVTSGGSTKLTSMATTDINSGGRLNVTAGGSTLAKPGDTAYTTVVSNGSWVVDIGSPATGKLDTALSGFSMTSYTGDLVFSALAGNYKVRTFSPNSVNLGGPVPNNPTSHAMIYETFKIFMDLFGEAFDTHIHPSLSSPPAIKAYEILERLQLLEKSKSVFVTLGG